MRYRFDPWELDWGNRELRCSNELVSVEPKVLQFLNVMLERHGHLITRDEVTKALWANVSVGRDALPRIVKEARKVLGDSGTEPKLLLTRRGHGYLFAASVEVISDSSRDGSSARPALTDVVQLHGSSLEAQGTTSLDQCDLFDAMRIQWLLPHARETVIGRARSTTIGRLSNCDLVLDGTGVSRQHAQCNFQGPIAVIRDLGSRNGTYLNGLLVTVAPLAENDVLRIGGWLGTLHRCTTEPGDRFQQLAPGYWGGRELMRLLQLANRAATNLNICGESGVGKSALAAAIHQRVAEDTPTLTLQCRRGTHSPVAAIERREIEIDCSRPIDLVMSMCEGAALVIDNIDYLDTELGTWLAELLLKLQARSFGCPCTMTTSRMSLADPTFAKTLPAPLVPVLMGTELMIPPLRARRSDILGLIAAFCSESGHPIYDLSAHAAENLMLYSWPGNTAELKNIVRKLALLDTSKTTINAQDLPPEFVLPIAVQPSTLQSVHDIGLSHRT